MNTRGIASEYRLTHWTQIMRERKESGLSIKAYCAGAGIHENVYFYWQRKLREAACEQLAQMERKQGEVTIPGFAEIKMEEPAPRQSAGDESGRVCVEGAGVQIRAESTYPIDKLAVLVRELMRSC